MASKARGLADLGNVYNDGALSNRNLIINGAMQVAQRGTSFSVGNGYTLDRWRVASNVVLTATKEEDTVDGRKVSVLKSTASGPAYHAIIQRIEGMRRIQGQTLTLSAWVKGSLGTYLQYAEFRNSSGTSVGSASESFSYTGQWQRFEWTFTAPTNPVYDNDSSWFNISFYGGDELSVTNVQLEQGDTATPFEHRSYSDELQRCKRYYEQFNYGTNSAVSTNHAYATWGCHGPLYYSEKRVSPTVSHTGAVACYTNTNEQTPTTLGFANPTTTSVNINPYGGVTFGINDAVFVISASWSHLSIKLDAEL